MSPHPEKQHYYREALKGQRLETLKGLLDPFLEQKTRGMIFSPELQIDVKPTRLDYREWELLFFAPNDQITAVIILSPLGESALAQSVNMSRLNQVLHQITTIASSPERAILVFNRLAHPREIGKLYELCENWLSGQDRAFLFCDMADLLYPNTLKPVTQRIAIMRLDDQRHHAIVSSEESAQNTHVVSFCTLSHSSALFNARRGTLSDFNSNTVSQGINIDTPLSHFDYTRLSQILRNAQSVRTN